MDNRNANRKIRSKDVLLELLANHKTPKTDIYKRMAEVAKRQGVLERVEVDKNMALDLLVLNTKNRMPITDSWRYIVQEMKEGKWKFTGDTIKVSWEPMLLDGQHTLIGVALSDTVQVLNIQTGLDPNVFDVIDTGRNRSAADMISMEGYESHQTTIAAAIKSVIYFNRDGRVAANISRSRVTNEEVVEWARKNKLNMPLMVRCCETVYKDYYKHFKDLSIATWTFIYYMFSKKDQAEAEKFCRLLAYGENISANGRHAAIWHLMKKLQNFDKTMAFSTKEEKGGSKPAELRIRYCFRAWNLWRSGVRVEKLALHDRVGKEGFRIEKPE